MGMITLNVYSLRISQHLHAARKLRQKFWQEMDAFYPALRDNPGMRADMNSFDLAIRDAIIAMERASTRSQGGRTNKVDETAKKPRSVPVTGSLEVKLGLIRKRMNEEATWIEQRDTTIREAAAGGMKNTDISALTGVSIAVVKRIVSKASKTMRVA